MKPSIFMVVLALPIVLPFMVVGFIARSIYAGFMAGFMLVRELKEKEGGGQ